MSIHKLIHLMLPAALISALVSLSITAIVTGTDGGYPERWARVYVFALPLAWVLRNVARPKMLRLRSRFSLAGRNVGGR